MGRSPLGAAERASLPRRLAAQVSQEIPAEHADEGEIVVYGPNVMVGYHNRAEENAKALTADGGLRTGDLCFQRGLALVGAEAHERALDGAERVVGEGGLDLEHRAPGELHERDLRAVGEDGALAAAVGGQFVVPQALAKMISSGASASDAANESQKVAEGIKQDLG